jgi:hypothetical protein
MAKITSLAILQPGRTPPEAWREAIDRAVKVLDEEEVVGLPATGAGAVPEIDDLLLGLEKRHRAVIVPVFCGQREMSDGELQRVKVIIGKPLPPETPAELVRREIADLVQGEGKDGGTSLVLSAMSPAASDASPTPPAANRPEYP